MCQRCYADSRVASDRAVPRGARLSVGGRLARGDLPSSKLPHCWPPAHRMLLIASRGAPSPGEPSTASLRWLRQRRRSCTDPGQRRRSYARVAARTEAPPTSGGYRRRRGADGSGPRHARAGFTETQTVSRVHVGAIRSPSWRREYTPGVIQLRRSERPETRREKVRDDRPAGAPVLCACASGGLLPPRLDSSHPQRRSLRSGARSRRHCPLIS